MAPLRRMAQPLNINSPDIYMKIPAHKIFNYRYEVSVSSILHNLRDDSSLGARTQFVQAILSPRPKLMVFLSSFSFFIFLLLLFSRTFIEHQTLGRSRQTLPFPNYVFSGTHLYFKILYLILFRPRDLKPLFISAWGRWFLYLMVIVFFQFPSFLFHALLHYSLAVVNGASVPWCPVGFWIIQGSFGTGALTQLRYDGISCFKTCLSRIYRFGMNGLCIATMGSAINQITK